MENKLNIIKSLGFREHNQEVALLDIINSYNELNESIGFHKKHEMSNKFNDSLGGIFGYNHLLNILYENKDLLYKEFKLDNKFIEYVKLIMLNERFHKGDHYYDRRYEYDFLNKKADINYLSCDINYISSLSKEQILQIFKIENLNYRFIFNKYIIRFFNNLLEHNLNIDNEILSEIVHTFAYEKSTIELILNHKEFNEKLLKELANNYEAEKDALELIKDKVNKMNTKSDKEIFLEKSMAGKKYGISANGFDLIYDFFLNFKEINNPCDNLKRKEYFSNNEIKIRSNINYEEFYKFINNLDNSFFNYYKIDKIEFNNFLTTLLVNSCTTYNTDRAKDFFTDFVSKLGFLIEINNELSYIKSLSKDDIINHIHNDPIGILVFNKVYIDFINNLLIHNENIDEEVLEIIIEWIALERSTNDLIINHECFNKDTMYDLLLDSNLPSDEHEKILKLKNENINLKENKMSKIITEINSYDEFIKLFDSGKHNKEELFNKITFIPNSLEELSKLYSIYKNRLFTESFDLFDISEDIMTDFICSLPLKELDSLTPWLKLFNLESYDGEFEVFKRLSKKK